MAVIEKSLSNVLKFLLIQDPTQIAIGFALGTSFSNIGLSIIDDVVKPLIKGNITDMKLKNVIEQSAVLIIFFIILYYLVIIPLNNLKKKYGIDIKEAVCPYCRTTISPNATRCPSCTSDLIAKKDI